MNKDFFKKIYLSLYLKCSCVWEGVGDRTELQYIDPHSYGHQRCVFLVLLNCKTGAWGPSHSGTCFHPSIFTPTCLQTARGSQGPLLLGGGFLYHILCPTSLSPTLSGVPRAPSAGWWLSLPYRVSKSSDIHLNWGSQRPFLPDGGFFRNWKEKLKEKMKRRRNNPIEI